MDKVIDGQAEFNVVEMTAGAIFDLIYPVGAVFATTGNAPARGTWEEFAQGRTLQGADSSHAVGTTIEAGLPNIGGNFLMHASESGTPIYQAKGAFVGDLKNDGRYRMGGELLQYETFSLGRVVFDASRSNPIYGNSSTVQPPAYVVHFYRRIA